MTTRHHLRKRASPPFLLAVAIGLSSICGPATASEPPNIEIDDLSNKELLSSFDTEPKEFTFLWSSGNDQVKLSSRAKFFRSSKDPSDSGSGNCSAYAEINTIECDLTILDELAAQFDIEGSRRSGEAISYSDDQVVLLRWIVSHELGHVALAHKVSSYKSAHSGFALLDLEAQRLELDADKYSISVLGSLGDGNSRDYSLLLDIVNSLIRRSLCPETYPESCDAISYGAGLIFNSSNCNPIEIELGETHPDFIARVLRILYLAGEGTAENSVNYLAKQAIERLAIKGTRGRNMQGNTIPREGCQPSNVGDNAAHEQDQILHSDTVRRIP